MTFFKRIYTGESEPRLYLTRVHLTPRLPWGQLFFHYFHRKDLDKDPHDHPWHFWTFPLRGYWEEKYVIDGDQLVPRLNWVRPFRFHRRKAMHVHRVLASRGGMTIVWHGRRWKRWGFWVKNEKGRRNVWVHWPEYCNEKGRHTA